MSGRTAFRLQAILFVVLPFCLCSNGCGAEINVLQAREQSIHSADTQNASARAFPNPTHVSAPVAGDRVTLSELGSYRHGKKGTSAAEIAAYDVSSKRLFVVNVEQARIDVLDMSNPVQLESVAAADVGALGTPTSVTARRGVIAASVLAPVPDRKGHVVFLTPAGEILKTLEVGFGPDMLTITPDGKFLLVANEGEPTDDYSIDPEGSVSLISLPRDVDPASLSQSDVKNLDFRAFDSRRDSLENGIRIFGRGASVSQDLEPEYIAVSPDSKTAWVACQENNAIAVIDLVAGKITRLAGLGFKDHNLPGNGLDASDRDNGINIRNWPVLGMFQPDGMAACRIGEKTYLLTANDGKDRDYDGFAEECRVADLQLDPRVFPDAAILQAPENLGRLRTTRVLGDADGDGLHEEIYSYGGRSFSIWTADVQPVFESGDQFERIIAAACPQNFNSDHQKDNFEGRSPAKGPEPEGMAVGRIGEHTYAFIGLERIGGVMVYDISIPSAPVFESYFNNRGFDGSGNDDLGPEGLLWISPEDSPNGVPLLVMSCEISGTTRVLRVETTAAEHLPESPR